MIKRIIFDLDNTLVMWKQEYISALEKTMRYFNVNIESKKIDDVIESMETKYKILSVDILLNEINKTCNLNLKMDFIDMLIEEQKILAEVDEEKIEVLKYLSKKYEIVVLTNFIKEVQVGRLEKAKMLPYIKEVYAGYGNIIKPYKEAFERAFGDKKIEECVMIGDSYLCDIKGALDIGLNVIGYDYKGKLPDGNYKKIKTFNELKTIL